MFIVLVGLRDVGAHGDTHVHDSPESCAFFDKSIGATRDALGFLATDPASC